MRTQYIQQKYIYISSTKYLYTINNMWLACGQGIHLK